MSEIKLSLPPSSVLYILAYPLQKKAIEKLSPPNQRETEKQSKTYFHYYSFYSAQIQNQNNTITADQI